VRVTFYSSISKIALVFVYKLELLNLIKFTIFKKTIMLNNEEKKHLKSELYLARISNKKIAERAGDVKSGNFPIFSRYCHFVTKNRIHCSEFTERAL